MNQKSWLLNLSLLKTHPAYRAVFIARFISILSLGLLGVAVPVQIQTMTHSSLLVGLSVTLTGGAMFIGLMVGGVLADRYERKKLILLAPAFNYINVGNAADLITGWFSSPNKKEQPDDYPPLPSDFTSVFMNVVDLLKQDAVLVECPVMILHGTEDETITVSSSRKIYKKIPAAQKGLILLEGVGHAILDDPAYASMALHTIAAFIDGQIHF